MSGIYLSVFSLCIIIKSIHKTYVYRSCNFLKWSKLGFLSLPDDMIPVNVSIGYMHFATLCIFSPCLAELE